MPTIVFDVLIPTRCEGLPEELGGKFQLALDILVRKARLTSGAVSMAAVEHPDEHVVKQLREVYENDHGVAPGEARLHRYTIIAQGPGISYNELAMGLSRILVDQAQLPKDPVALERYEDFELPSLFPWVVDIRP